MRFICKLSEVCTRANKYNYSRLVYVFQECHIENLIINDCALSVLVRYIVLISVRTKMVGGTKGGTQQYNHIIVGQCQYITYLNIGRMISIIGKKRYNVTGQYKNIHKKVKTNYFSLEGTKGLYLSGNSFVYIICRQTLMVIKI